MTKTRLLIALLLPLAACSDSHREQPITAQTGIHAVVVVGDFQQGNPGLLSTLDPATGAVQMDIGPAGAVGADPVLRHIGDELVIVNRGENNITILDDRTLAFKEQLGVGAGAAAQDVAVVGDKLYVPGLLTRGVTVLTRGSTATTEIDLSMDDPDGQPNCDSIYRVDSQLYVACGLLDEKLAPRGPGKVYVIDTATDRVVPALTVTLGHANPFGWFERFPDGSAHAGDLVIATVENFQAAPGCIERITPGTEPRAAGCLVDNAALGGYSSRLDIESDADGQIVWALVGIPNDFKHGNLRTFDLSLNTLWPEPLNPSSQLISDVVHCPSGQVVVFDSTEGAPGLRIYDGAETTTAALPIGKVQAPFPQHGLICYETR